MDISRLAEFIAVVEHGSLVKAARALYTSQSVLSKHMIALEKELGIPLLERTTAGVRTTAAGQALLLSAVQITSSYDEMLATIEGIRRARHDSLSIALFVGYKPIDDLVKALTLDLRKASPNIDLSLRDITTNDPLEDVRAGDVDLAFVTMPEGEDTESLEVLPVVSEPVCCLVNDRHPLAAHEDTPIASLEGEVVWQATGGAAYMSRCVRDVFARHGVHPRYLPFSWTCARDYYDRMAFVEGGVHIEFESAAYYSVPLSTGICRLVRIGERPTITTHAVWRKDSENPVMRDLRERIEAITNSARFAEAQWRPW